MTMHALWDVMN